MKNKFIAAAAEVVIFNLLSLFLVWKLFILPHMETAATVRDGEHIVSSGLLLFVIIYAVGMFLLGVHIYINMVKPVSRAQEDLKRAAEESCRAESIRREFVANVSHEIKTPLTSISGFIETLQQGAAEDPEIRTKFIDIIAIETSRLKRLIQDLLVLSDIENRRDTADEQEFSVGEFIEKTVAALEPIAEEKHIQLITAVEEDLSITGSADRFRQMMVNLIENAIKYSEDGGRVWIEARQLSGTSSRTGGNGGTGCTGRNGRTDAQGQQAGGDPGRQDKCAGDIQVSVKDEGIGIAEEHLDRLFERFYRVDKSRSTKAGGTGLGLSIVKHIAALFGADLKVESKEGKGTIFYVIFHT